MPNRERTPAFGTKELPSELNVTAPDGSHVREPPSLPSGSAAHFELPPGVVSRAGRHRTVDEIRFIVAGRSEMWRRDGSFESAVHPLHKLGVLRFCGRISPRSSFLSSARRSSLSIPIWWAVSPASPFSLGQHDGAPTTGLGIVKSLQFFLLSLDPASKQRGPLPAP